MSGLAIRAERLGKRYRVGTRFVDQRGMHALLERSVRAPLERLTGRAGGGAAVAHGHFAWAIREVSFGVDHGEIVGLLGPNGAGKSVLLKILARVTKPTEGRASIHGRVGSMLEAGAGFHPELTGRENVFLSGAILGMKRADIARQFADIVDFAGTGEYLDTPVKRYSSGMGVRLAIAVAVHLPCEVLLVDEVLAVGDESFRRATAARLAALGRQGRAIILVSHDLDIVRRLCNRALLLRHGHIVMDDSTERVTACHLEDARASEDSRVSV